MALRALHDLPAPAKLNLFLHVVGRRDDGYHLLQSVFVPIDWCDTLHLERREDGRLVRHDLGTPLPADDLCLRAARALQAAAGVSLGVDIHIDKRLPAGAGMGGGSSDAATVLLGLNRLWGLHWPRPRLQALALGLGADVPFFVGGRPAWVEGIGERLSPLDLPPMRFAVVKPPAAIETRAIFGSELLRRDTQPAILASFLASDGLQRLAGGFGCNDLQPAAEAVCAEVGEARRWLTQRFGNARMTGSGSAVFARAGNDDASDRTRGSRTGESPAAAAPDGPLQGLPDGWTGRLCRSLGRHPLLDWAADPPGLA
ncbi:4-(cytidine 5'-diphospho)-2-C-methyl-D-erythritol kinase [Piscinibacter sakaiensis]|uniref:4-diphosphocytidyl-2-C-methyl-D-erythritol kinase n=1 Tax=Piscinibacter sakaiensis TaxID=1547922 RepID=A0A0K8P675_PISS1|nr:4-(cytidine 5'-diphospho)-2-C-methyl-D-erythritol kinase [Piscinibacter sakaiensis]GAP37705.1 4-diphosphocytidyl-2-C-methyl-D-erythritol kinase [Piscinibacter sakaiensis]